MTEVPAVPDLSRRRVLLMAGWLLAPSLLNDLANIFVSAPVAWLACDYGSRALSLACVAWLVRIGLVEVGALGLGWPPWGRGAIALAVGTAGGLALMVGPGPRALLEACSSTQLGGFPEIEPPWLHRLDYVGGLALVAVSEELVFRGALPALLRKAGGSPAAAFVGSAAAFGVAHWSLGVGSVLQTAAVGLVLGGCVRASRSLWPAILAHYVIDLVAFG